MKRQNGLDETRTYSSLGDINSTGDTECIQYISFGLFHRVAAAFLKHLPVKPRFWGMVSGASNSDLGGTQGTGYREQLKLYFLIQQNCYNEDNTKRSAVLSLVIHLCHCRATRTILTCYENVTRVLLCSWRGEIVNVCFKEINWAHLLLWDGTRGQQRLCLMVTCLVHHPGIVRIQHRLTGRVAFVVGGGDDNHAVLFSCARLY